MFEDAAHLTPADAPATVAGLLAAPRPADDPYATGMAVRRAVLGDVHVDRAIADTHRADRTQLARRTGSGAWT